MTFHNLCQVGSRLMVSWSKLTVTSVNYWIDRSVRDKRKHWRIAKAGTIVAKSTRSVIPYVKNTHYSRASALSHMLNDEHRRATSLTIVV
jgi:hypothetical protein